MTSSPVRGHIGRGTAGDLCFEVNPGGRKGWRWKYRHAGEEKLLSMGVPPDVTLAQARERRDEARRLLPQGIDPSVQRKLAKAARVERAANSVDAVAREWLAKTCRSPGSPSPS